MEHLHRTQNPSGAIPSKLDAPIEFMQPVVTDLINRLSGIQPPQADTSAIRRLQSVQAELAQAKQQLAAAGISPESARAAPSSPVPSPPTSNPSGRNPGMKRPHTSSSLMLGASPKKRPRRPAVVSQAVASGNGVFKSNATLSRFWNSASQAAECNEEQSVEAGEVIPPAQEEPQEIDDSVKPEPGVIAADATVERWFSNFPEETKQVATKFASVLADANVPKPKLQEAAIKYGLPIDLFFKLPPRSLNKIVSVAAALTAWLAMDTTRWLRVDMCRFFQVRIDSAPMFSRIYPWASQCSENGGNVGFEFATSCFDLSLLCPHPWVTQVAQQTTIFENQSVHVQFLVFFRVSVLCM